MVLGFILSMVALCGASFHEQYRVPQTCTDKWESFVYEDKEYIIQNLPITWETAKIMCRGHHNGTLAILDTKEKAEFLAEALAESQFAIDSVWVGARRHGGDDPAGYRWGNLLELRRTADDVRRSSPEDRDQYPAWQNRTHVPVPETGADCVAVQRVSHDRGVFLDLPCELERPFVCEREAQTRQLIKELKTVRCRTGLYRMYDGLLDWHQAAAYCVLRKMRLVPLSPKFSSDDGIHEELRELFKNSRETYSDFSIFSNKPSICIQKVAFGEMELVRKTTDGHPKIQVFHGRRLVPLSPKSSSDDGIHEELRELFKNSRETYSDFSIFGNKLSICIQKVAFGEMELVKKTTDGHPKIQVFHGRRLANIATMKCLKKLGTTMLKTRPSIENAWVGARGELGKWTWVDSGASIFLPSPYSDVDNAVWPPMRDRSSVKQNGCLQLDRHATHAPVFLEARCERKMQFICYQGSPALRTATLPPSDDNYYYVLVKQLLFWQHAYENCIKMNATLAYPGTSDIMTQLLLIMGENKEEPIEHIWISGRLNMTKNVSTDEIEYGWYNPLNNKAIADPKNTRRTKGTYMAPWLDEEFTRDNSCLNLDRQDHLKGLTYGLPCDTPQYSICMIEKSPRVLKSENVPATSTQAAETVDRIEAPQEPPRSEPLFKDI